MTNHADVLIVGAGISGICAAYYLQARCPTKTYTILEGRHTLGGTWDLFRYPGIRSDSDMYTLGFSFRPWTDDRAIADGESILNYVRDTAEEFDIVSQIRFNHFVHNARWSSEDAQWTVAVTHNGEPTTFSCNFLYMCAGYYDYEQGHRPQWDGENRFQGRIIHPQHWDEQLNYEDKDVVVIGSGATAVTLVPALAGKANHVTMLQRSPTYIVSMPQEDQLAHRIHRVFPTGLAHRLVRWKAILESIYHYVLMRRYPETAKTEIVNMVREELGEDYDVDTHFTPTYDPWDQRLCLVPDSDLFKAINAGKVSVVTDTIDHFNEQGLCLKSGDELKADIIITATGLTIKMMGGIQLEIDGEPIEFKDTVTYKGMMFSDIPNFVSSIGYTNASWTLKAELIAEYVCRLLNYMDRHQYVQCTPRTGDTPIDDSPLINLDSGYINRALDKMPKQSSQKPWKVYQNYVRDLFNLRYNRLNDGAMEFK